MLIQRTLSSCSWPGPVKTIQLLWTLVDSQCGSEGLLLGNGVLGEFLSSRILFGSEVLEITVTQKNMCLLFLFLYLFTSKKWMCQMTFI